MRGKQALNGWSTFCGFTTHFDVDPN